MLFSDMIPWEDLVTSVVESRTERYAKLSKLKNVGWNLNKLAQQFSSIIVLTRQGRNVEWKKVKSALLHWLKVASTHLGKNVR